MPKIEEAMNTRFANDKHRLLSNIVYTGGWIKGQFNQFIEPFGLSSPQFNVLRILRGADEWVAMNEVKRRMVEKSPNTTRLCDKLIAKQVVERRRSKSDRRLVHLRITKQGLQLLKKIDEQDDGTQILFTKNITNEEAKLVSKILDKMRG